MKAALTLLVGRLNTSPGTKLELTGSIQVRQGFIHLYRNSARVLGGHVEKLVESWELKRVRTSIFKHEYLFSDVLHSFCRLVKLKLSGVFQWRYTRGIPFLSISISRT